MELEYCELCGRKYTQSNDKHIEDLARVSGDVAGLILAKAKYEIEKLK